MTDFSADDEQAILDLTREIQEAWARGDDAAAKGLLDDLTDRFGVEALAAVMAARDDRERLGVEVELLRLLGPRLYGER